MSAKLRRFPEYRVTLAMFSGTVTDDDSIKLFREIDERDRDFHVVVFSVKTPTSATHLSRPLI